MAPNFFQKLAKVASPSTNRDTNRERVSVSSDSAVSSSASSRDHRARSQSASIVGPPGSSPSTPTTPTQSAVLSGSGRQNTSFSGENRIPSIITTISNGTKNLGKKKSKSRNRSRSRSTDRRSLESVGTSLSTQPNVTVIPPSPLNRSADLSDSDDDETKSSHSAQGTAESANTADTTPEPTPTAAKPSSLQTSTTTVNSPANSATPSPPMSSTLAPGTYQLRKQPSNKSIGSKKGGLPDITVAPATTTTNGSSHARAATAPAEVNEHGVIVQRPMVESPTDVKFPGANGTSPPGTVSSTTSNGNGSIPSVARENTNATLVAPDKGGKRPWRRSTTRKPTGLASAIAASGLAMANPTLSAAQQAQMPPPTVITPGNSKGGMDGKQPYMSRSPTQSSVSQRSHGKTRSGELSPRSNKSRKGSSKGRRSRRTSDATSVDPEGSRPDYYNGLGDDSSDEDETDSDSDSLGIGEEDIPVTGFAVASNKRNADFHDLFPTVPEGDYLIEDYGCALQREILIQGRIYISENHICFHANIFGWITDLSIPIYEITSLEKKMTALFIPNAIQITTRQNKYTFASFLSRDTTFDVIYNIWRLARPEDGGSGPSSGHASVDGLPNTGSITGGAVSMANSTASAPPATIAASVRKPTQCLCGKENKHYSETALEIVIPGTPEKIHNLMFASGFMKDFMSVNQKLLDIQMSDWSPVSPNSKLLMRNMSYIKPLNGSLGPKQTKCEIKDEVASCDFDQYVSTVTTTRTPDVPSGGVFSVKTRTCIMWAGPLSSKVIVTTQVEWTGRSFIKGIIERSAIDGQKVYHNELEKAMRSYIQEHKSEFLPEGIDAAVISEAPPEAVAAGPAAETNDVSTGEKDTTQEQSKQRERERNARGLQWAYDTFDGAWQVGMRSAKGAIELLRDAWDQSSSSTILWFVIVVLVISNLWTLLRVNSGHAEAVRKKELRKVEEREKWVHSIVTALWDELEAGKRVPSVSRGAGQSLSPPPLVAPPAPQPVVEQPAQQILEPIIESKVWVEEVEKLSKTLDMVEERVKAIRESIIALKEHALD